MASKEKRAKQDFNQILIEQLKCYICKSGLKVGKHRWYRCLQLHMICQDCKETKEAIAMTAKCSCKKKFLLEYCKMTEALLNTEKMRFNCENQSRGCQEKLDEENMIFHQSECIYRLVECPNLKCRSKVPFHDLLNHMKTEEFKCDKLTGSIGKMVAACWTTPPENQLPGVIFASQELEVNGIGTFIIGAKIEKSTFYHWIHFLGSSHEAKKFSYTFEYKNEEKTPHVHTFHSNQMVSIDETSKSIIESGKCFGMPRKLFDKHVLEDRRFAYSVTIRNLKEEAKDDNVESGVSDNDD